MNISLIIPWRSGERYRERCAEFVVNHYNTFLRSVPGLHEIIVQDDEGGGPFNRGRACAQGVEKSVGDVLLLADADAWIPLESLGAALEAVSNPSYGFITPFNHVRYVNNRGTRRMLKGILKPDNIPEKYYRVWDRVNDGLCQFVLRKNYDLSRGFDPRFVGWGFEDRSWSVAIQTLVAPKHSIPNYALHLYHLSAKKSDDENMKAGYELSRRYYRANGDREAILKIIEERAK